MKKQILAGGVTASAMALALACRLWQRSTAFEPDSGLLTRGAPATWGLLAVVLAGAAALLAVALQAAKGGEVNSYLAAFAQPGAGMVLCLAAGAALVAAGIVGVRAHRVDDQLSRYILSIALVPTGLDMALIGWLNTQPREAAGRFAWPLLLPGYTGCLWLVAAYQEHTAEPNVMAYALYFVGAVCAVSCCYLMASFSFEKPQPVWTLWTGGMALVLLVTRLADYSREQGPFEQLVCLGYLLYLLGQCAALTRNLARPAELQPWTPPAEPTDPLSPDQAPAEETTQDIEVTDHE